MSGDLLTRESVLEAVRNGTPLENQKLKGIDLSGTDLRGAQLAGSQFRYSDLREADLRGADLQGANLRHVNLTGANLSGADMRNADLAHADIRGALLTDAKLAGAKLDGARGLSAKAFFPQAVIDKLISDGAGELEGDEFAIASRGERWRLVSAARIVGLEAGADVKGILNKLLSEDELKAEGLQVYRDTALLAEGDTVYKLVPGFVGCPLHEIKPRDATDPSTTPATTPPDDGDKKSDQELINDFLLKRLTTS